LEDDLEPPSGERGPNQLIPVTISLVSSNLEVLEEALDGFVKSYPVLKKLVVIEIVLENPGA
jgi:hypothetical protein